MLSGIGPATLRKASQVFGFESKSVESLAGEIPQLERALSPRDSWSNALALAEEQLELAAQRGIQILSPLDGNYPRLLAATKDDPMLLYVRGRLASAPEKSVAIIGTREPTPHGEVITRRITRYFVEQGWSVVSGLALGCDAIAHREAIQVKGHTVAVLAHGLQTVAPAKHRKLAEEIVESGGALVSQYPTGREPIPQQFVQRDKTQAGMAQGVVMVQSDIQGGSLHASRAAIEYSRWLAIPYPTDLDVANREKKVQANLLFAEGSKVDVAEILRRNVSELDKARVHILRSRDDYAKILSWTNRAQAEPPPPSQGAIF